LKRRKRIVANTAEKKDEYFAYHSSAAALILCAAQESGLLKNVTEMMLARDKYTEEGIHVSDCPQCELLRLLTEAFDEPACLPSDVWSEFYYGTDMPSYPAVELKPYLTKPGLSDIPA
jgi:hypothetical protein